MVGGRRCDVVTPCLWSFAFACAHVHDSSSSIETGTLYIARRNLELGSVLASVSPSTVSFGSIRFHKSKTQPKAPLERSSTTIIHTTGLRPESSGRTVTGQAIIKYSFREWKEWKEIGAVGKRSRTPARNDTRAPTDRPPPFHTAIYTRPFLKTDATYLRPHRATVSRGANAQRLAPHDVGH